MLKAVNTLYDIIVKSNNVIPSSDWMLCNSLYAHEKSPISQQSLFTLIQIVKYVSNTFSERPLNVSVVSRLCQLSFTYKDVSTER